MRRRVEPVSLSVAAQAPASIRPERDGNPPNQAEAGRAGRVDAVAVSARRRYLPPRSPHPAEIRFPDRAGVGVLERPGATDGALVSGNQQNHKRQLAVRSQRAHGYILNTAPVHANGKPFDEPKPIEGSPFWVETFVDRNQARLRHPAARTLRGRAGLSSGSRLSLPRLENQASREQASTCQVTGPPQGNVHRPAHRAFDSPCHMHSYQGGAPHADHPHLGVQE